MMSLIVARPYQPNKGPQKPPVTPAQQKAHGNAVGFGVHCDKAPVRKEAVEQSGRLDCPADAKYALREPGIPYAS